MNVPISRSQDARAGEILMAAKRTFAQIDFFDILFSLAF